MKEKFKKILTLFCCFFKIGAFTFGGGYAMIPLIEKEAVENKKWITNKDVLDVIAIAESTPGPIAINSATFIGYKVAGFFGALAATLGVILPSFTIIFILSLIIRHFNDLTVVKYAFMGIRAGVLALIIKALISMYKQCPKGVVSYILMALSLVLSAFTDISIIFIIIGCGLAGLVSSLLSKETLKKGREK